MLTSLCYMFSSIQQCPLRDVFILHMQFRAMTSSQWNLILVTLNKKGGNQIFTINLNCTLRLAV